jgi:hypothetical protein
MSKSRINSRDKTAQLRLDIPPRIKVTTYSQDRYAAALCALDALLSPLRTGISSGSGERGGSVSRQWCRKQEALYYVGTCRQGGL